MEHSRSTQWCRPTCLLFLWAAALLTLPLSWACGVPITAPPITPEENPQLQATGSHEAQDYRLEPGDTVKITFPFQPEMDQEGIIVRPDGKIAVPLVGEVLVTDKTPIELEKFLEEQTSDRLRNPEVVINITQFPRPSVLHRPEH